MEAELWRRVEELFQAVMAQPQEHRAAFLLQACPDDPQLRSEVQSLLDAAPGADSFLEDSPVSIVLSLKPGQKIEHFEIIGLLGRGGMGEVWRARDLMLDREVALKFLPAEMARERGAIERFEREARAASALNHPNIVGVYEVSRTGGASFIVSELVEGETLARVLQRGPLPLRKLIEVSTQIADGITAAHAAGVVHRDLKPGNIMLTRDGRVKILDFGLARRPRAPGIESATMRVSYPGVIMGTPGYMSPEQVRGESTDARSDLFSVGVILYEMASGKPAFRGTSSIEVMNSVLKDEPPDLPPASPPALDRIIRRCIEKQPARRFQSAADLSFALNTSLTSSAKRGGEIRGKRAVVAGVLVAAALAVAAYLWVTRRMTPRVTNIVQITHDGNSKGWMVTDGTRLYYTVDAFGVEAFQISASGGEPVKMPSLAGMFFDDISSDRSEFLLRHFAFGVGVPLWAAPVVGGAPRRLGDLTTTAGAAWSPDGDRIVYSKGPEIWIARSDGTESRILATGQGPTALPRWSPDGLTIRFTMRVRDSVSLWEISADGSHLHEVFPEWADHWESGARWTPDGRYFLFYGGTLDNCDLWALREKSRLPLAAHRPERLTTGPLQASNPVSSPDGRRIFFIGRLNGGEFVRYDPRSPHWLTYLPGISATQLEYSHDGKWLSYVSFPGSTLWRSDAEGGQRLQLTSAPLQIWSARWSPDGKQIAFDGAPPGQPSRVYIVPAAGGRARQLTDGESGGQEDASPSWPPDGASLVFSRRDLRAGKTLLSVVEVNTGRVSVLPGSQGLFSPRYSPDGRYIAAIEVGAHHLVLYDIDTHRQTDLSPNLNGYYPCWSRDGRFIYFEYNYLGDHGSSKLYRVRVQDRKLELLASLEGVRFPQLVGEWFGLAPDDSLLSIRDTGGTDIYRLDWDAP